MIIVHPVNSIQCNLQYLHTHIHCTNTLICSLEDFYVQKKKQNISLCYCHNFN